MKDLINHIEAIIFSSETPVSIEDLFGAFQKISEVPVDEASIRTAMEALLERYRTGNFVFEIKQSGGGYQFLTKPVYHKSISIFINEKAKKKLSSAALETLSIIAYKEPVTKVDIEKIRGVSSDYTVHKLLEKELIEIKGKQDSPGKPILYGLSEYFLDYFGMNSREELPKLKEIMPSDDNTVGEAE